MTHRKTETLNAKGSLDLIEIIPTAMTELEDGHPKTHKESICKGRYEKSDKGYKLYRHLERNRDCMTLHKLDNAIMEKCPKCNTWRGNDDELQKHITLHCHLSAEEKEYFKINEDKAPKLNRNATNPSGLPRTDISLANNKVKYDAKQKIWVCLICNRTNKNIIENKSSIMLTLPMEKRNI